MAAADLEGFAHSAAAQVESADEVTHVHWAAEIRKVAFFFMGVLTGARIWSIP